MNDFITVFTATYNRAYCLLNLYKSLCEQDCKNFEWLIVDDGSIDKTNVQVEEWKNENRINIRYTKLIHGGKHRALNYGFDNAKGNYFFSVDSDDKLTHDALSSIYSWIEKIEDFDNYCGVAGLRQYNNGSIIGDKPRFEFYIDATNLERRKYGLLGDKAEVYKTDLLRKFKFPEYPNEFFVTEDYCFMQIAAEGYKLRWYNKPIYICEYLEDGLTKTGANGFEGHKSNYRGYCDYIKKCLTIKKGIDLINSFDDYNTFHNSLKSNMSKRFKDIDILMINYFKLFSISLLVKLLRVFYKLYKRFFVENKKFNN